MKRPPFSNNRFADGPPESDDDAESSSPPPRRSAPAAPPRWARTAPRGNGPRVDIPVIPSATELAVRVIGQADRDHPADNVLRDELRATRGLPRATSSEVARLVFGYFRWRAWLNPDQPLPEQLAEVPRLIQEFAINPDTFTDARLLEKAVPAWAHDAVEVTPAWVRSLQAEPRLWLRARPGTGDDLAARLPGSRPGPLPDSLIYEGAEDLFRRPEFQAGEFEVQDIASQAVGWLAGAKPGETWWDACAGEGGKTLHLSALMANRGLIWTSDRAEWRLKKLKLRAARAKCFNYRAVPWDGGARPPTRTMFHGVLVDAPCSGVGTWQRNPHARWTTTPADVEELGSIQGALLQHVAGSVRPGGRLIYSVCTLTRRETRDVVTAFTAAHPEFRPLVLTAPAGLPVVPGPEGVWLWPQDTRGSGMFVAGWERLPARAE